MAKNNKIKAFQKRKSFPTFHAHMFLSIIFSIRVRGRSFKQCVVICILCIVLCKCCYILYCLYTIFGRAVLKHFANPVFQFDSFC